MAEKAERKGFFLTFHMMETLLMLPPAQQEKLMLACYAYHKGEEPDVSDAKVAFAFRAFREEFDAAAARHQEICDKRRAAVQSRWKDSNDIQNDTNVSEADSNGIQNDINEHQEQVLDIKKIQDTPYGVSVAAAGDDHGKELPAGDENSPAAGLPPCPHGEIVNLYHEILPELPRVKVWEGGRKTALQARWRESLARKKIRDKAGGLDYWRGFFGYVRQCPLLMGRVTGRDGRTWHADLPWLVKAENFAKVIEGRYRTEAEQ